MNNLSRSHAGPAAPDMSPLQTPDAALASRDPAPENRPLFGTIRHAILDARAGRPVIIRASDSQNMALAMLPAETATNASLASFLAAHAETPQLVLARSRADAMGYGLDDKDQDRGQDGPTAAPDLVAFDVQGRDLNVAILEAMTNPVSRIAPVLSGDTAFALVAPHALARAAVALAKLARLLPAVLVAPANPSTSAISISSPEILGFADQSATALHRVAEATLPLAEAADARLVAYRPDDGGPEHLALLVGRPEEADAPLVRIHSECFTGDLLGSLRCDCGPQLHQAIRRMAAEGSGVLLYMAQEGRGIGLVNKLRAYALQDRGLDTLDANRALGWGADERSFAAASVMLRDLGVTRVRLLTNNPDKVAALQAAGIEVAGRLRHAIAANGVNDGYLETKARRFGHLLG
jgi:GTP cyclohydrolase II